MKGNITSLILTLDRGGLRSSERGLQKYKAQVSKVTVKPDLPLPRPHRSQSLRPCVPHSYAPRPHTHLLSGAIHSPLRPKSHCAFLHALSSHPLQATSDALFHNHFAIPDQGVYLSPAAAAAESTTRDSILT